MGTSGALSTSNQYVKYSITLIEKLFEEKVLGNLSEERFLKMSAKYEDEQFELKQQIKHMKKIIAEEKVHEMNADSF